ncbi:Fc.00g112840.m01.CDS01 [Cosmosporella sp. VM-42]
MSSDRLNVIALISGGKDSFFSLLHCLDHGHRIVALANLFPGTTEEASEQHPEASRSSTQLVDPAAWAPGLAGHDGGVADHQPGEPSDRDLNSFMYQTVGHEVLPLYAAATGLPLYRQPIGGRAVRHERDYDSTAAAQASGSDGDADETESMLPLLRTILRHHPEANALCAGAILSTYQRTRVESIAVRLGLTPLAFLWQYPVLPPPAAAAGASETQLLLDMASAGLEARIIKVASAGLDEDHLWERVSSEAGAGRVRSALRKFGASEGAASLGEGGEFETLVLDAPRRLFRRRICVPEEGRKIVREGGGCSWLMLRGARVEEKTDGGQEDAVRTPDMLDPRFNVIFDALPSAALTQMGPVEFGPGQASKPLAMTKTQENAEDLLRWSVLTEPGTGERSIQEETIQVVEKIRGLLSAASVDASNVTNTIIALRRMSDFPKVNAEYGKLFPKPNPPSRVTISCGDLLPPGCNIAVYLTAPSPKVKVDRNGLHVQSRSYWAPANIGPYSQAIDIPVTARHQDTGIRSIAIAGQIPLLPATMLLPSPSDTSHELQIVLSLQHLWRIAMELKVQCWTSAVAYFPRSSITDMERNSKLAGLTWKQAFGTPEDEDDDADGPDAWDLKYNPQFSSLAGNNQQELARALPDWPIFTLHQQNEPDTCIPPVFAVEVEELPRQAAVEWHAHNGLTKVGESSVKTTFFTEVGVEGFETWNFIVQGSNATIVYTTVAWEMEQQNAGGKPNPWDLMGDAYQESLKRLIPDGPGPGSQSPYLMYVDHAEVDFAWPIGRPDGVALIPCHSIWSSWGQRLRLVALYETIFHE